MTKRHILFLVSTIIALGVLYTSLRELFSSAAGSDYYDHIMLIPLVSGYLFYVKRKEIFAKIDYSVQIGSGVIVAGIVFYIIGRTIGVKLNQNDYSSLMTSSALVFWTGTFILFYGIQAFRIASFPILFLVFMVPIPSVLMENIIYALQVGSTEATYMIFKMMGIPFSRNGFIFQLPGINIEVAKQCSGIRSSMALFITSILAGHIFLQTGWKKVILFLVVFPITIIKNGIRIVTLTLLAMYVDEGFLTGGFLHKSGGFLFYIPALGLLGLIVWFFRRNEKQLSRRVGE